MKNLGQYNQESRQQVKKEFEKIREDFKVENRKRTREV